MPGGDPGEFPGIAPSPPPALPRSLWLLRLPPCAAGICPATGDVTSSSSCHWRAGKSGANGGAGGGSGGGAALGAGPSGAARWLQRWGRGRCWGDEGHPRHRDSLLAHSGAPRTPEPPFLGAAIPQNPHSWAWVPPCTPLSGTNNPGTPSRPFRLSQPPEPHFPLPRDPPGPYSCLSQHPAPPFLNPEHTRHPYSQPSRLSPPCAGTGVTGGPWSPHSWIQAPP